jgi:hypothetical protein
MIAAAGGIARVIEGKAPPIDGQPLLLLAAAALEPPTDAVVAESAFPPGPSAWESAHALGSNLPRGARVVVVPRGVPPPDEKAAAERIAAKFLEPRAPSSGESLRAGETGAPPA